MTDTHKLVSEFEHLTALERHIIDRYIRRERLGPVPRRAPLTFGERVADHVASFGGSWTFIGIAAAAIIVWMVINARMSTPLDAFPFILLNLILSCLAALQAPIIMMSQNRQAAHDRLDAQHDYEINSKAELEIVALHAKIDEIRDQKWAELLSLQERQLALLAELAARDRG